MKYWAYVNNEILGPFEKEKLLELPSFSPALLVCPQTPVGEKTEDWKEASSYPELSALIGAGGALSGRPPAQQAAPAAAPAPAPAPAQEAAKREIVEPAPAITTFKPLTASALDPVPPSDHKIGGVDIPTNKLGKVGAPHEAAPAPAPAPAPVPEPAPAPAPAPILEQEPRPAPAPAAEAAQNAPGFDPITLSTIAKRSDTPAQAAAPAAAPEIENFAPVTPLTGQAAPAGPAPELENFSRPAYAPAPAQDNKELLQKLAALEKNAVSRQDMTALVDPLRQKLDQMGEVLASMKNQQFQREIMDKLAYLENAVGDLKSGMKSQPEPQIQASIAPAQAKEPSGRGFFGMSSSQAAAPAKEEKPKSAPPPAQDKIVDTGSKNSKIGALFRKLFRFIFTLVLLAAVALGAVFFLKNFGIFDATPFIPFQIPFISGTPAAQPEAQPQPEPAAAQQPAAEAAPAQPPAKDISPEIVYFTRTYKLAADGPSLEDKLIALSLAAGGDYARVDWKVQPGVENIYEIAALVPGKDGASLAYTFVADYAKKTLLPADPGGTQALEALAGKAPPKKVSPKQGRKAAQRAKAQAARKAAAAAAPAPAPKAAPAKPAAPAEDEYEYEYVDEEEEEAGQ